jgi:hypothetical protein
MMESARSLPYLANTVSKDSTDIRFRKRRIDRCAISVIHQQTWQDIPIPLLGHDSPASASIPQLDAIRTGGRYLSFLHNTAQAIRSSLFASATIATFWWLRASSCANHALSPGAWL